MHLTGFFLLETKFRTNSNDLEAAVEEEDEDIETAVGNFVDDHVEEAEKTTSNNSFNRTLWQTERSHNVSFASCEQKQQQQTFQRVSSLDETSLIVRLRPIIKSNGKTSDVSASSKDNCPRHN